MAENETITGLQSEERLQAECFQWLWNTKPQFRGLCWHVPNEGKRNPITGNRLKAIGLVAGVPDLQFCYCGNTYFFELKTAKGRVSDKQAKIQSMLTEHGFQVYIIRDFDTFKKLINQIINSGNNAEHNRRA